MTSLSKPHFLCIGAQKAGTTWLYQNLRQHPEIWLPPIKEIHYFDRSNRPFILDALRGRHQRDMLWRWLQPALENLRQHPQNIGWHMRFFLGWRGDGWYEKLFQNAPHQRAGDITPAYARLSLDQVRRVYERLPDAKIIYLLRNPIDRTWSQAAMYFSRFGYQGLEQASEVDIANFLNWDMAQRNSDYLQTLDIWRQFYSQEQIQVIFFEQIVESPTEAMQAIFRFIGVDAHERHIQQDIGEKVHHRPHDPMSETIAVELARRYYPQILKLHQMFGNVYTQRWLESVSQTLHQAHLLISTRRHVNLCLCHP